MTNQLAFLRRILVRSVSPIIFSSSPPSCSGICFRLLGWELKIFTGVLWFSIDRVPVGVPSPTVYKLPSASINIPFPPSPRRLFSNFLYIAFLPYYLIAYIISFCFAIFNMHISVISGIYWVLPEPQLIYLYFHVMYGNVIWL